MKRAHKNSRKFCFISNSNQSYLSDYLDLSDIDTNLNFSFKDINFSKLKSFAPHVIIVDQYFCEKDFTSIIESIKMNFTEANIYFLSPIYSNYNGLIQSVNNKKHFYSNLSKDILSHINPNLEKTYLEAS